MELLTPRITIQNIKPDRCLVRMEHKVSDLEVIDITLNIKRAADLAQLQRQLIEHAMALLTKMQNSLGT